MTTHLISILGLPQKNPRSGDRTYRTTTYRFQDGGEFADLTTATFGMALAEWFGRRTRAPMPFDRILWLGTAQSAWGSLLQSALGDGAIEEAIFLEICDAPEVSPKQLVCLAEALTRATGQRHECRLIPPCVTPAEQLEFVSVLSGELNPKDRVVLDLTHGFRNQSLMLAQSALMLEGAFGVRIEGMFYGAFEAAKPPLPAPAVELTGLLVQARLAQALAAFRASGDLRLLAVEVPEGEHPDLKQTLETLGHAMATNDFPRVQEFSHRVLDLLGSSWAEELLGPLRLPITKAVQQVNAPYLADSQIQLAEAHLARKDYLRAAITATEAVVSDQCERTGRDKTKYQEREAAQKEIPGRAAWNRLEHIRNHIAHGFGGFRGIPAIVCDPKALHASLGKSLAWARQWIKE